MNLNVLDKDYTVQSLDVAPKHFINGSYCTPTSKEVIEILDPSTGEVMDYIARGTVDDINNAVKAAKNSLQGDWGKKTPLERSRILMNIANIVLENKLELASIEKKDTGKPLNLALLDIETVARYFEYYAGAVDKVHGSTIPYSNEFCVLTLREPVGVVGHIIPWNYPAQMLGRTLAPALAMGNASVIKPSEDACLTSLRFLELATEAGLPPGAANIVTGYGHEVGEALTTHPDVELITFTGSPAVGIKVQQNAALNYTRCLLELGGKSPQILFKDANLAKAIPAVVKALVQNAGQTCSAGTRLIVQKEIYKEVIELIKSEFENLVAGPPESDPHCGPIITKRQYLTVKQFIQECKDDEIGIIGEGKISKLASKNGFFIKPIVFGPVPENHKLAQEEIFGPVLSIIPFEDESDAVRIANNTQYGLVSSVWTENGARQLRMAKKIQSGQVFINCYGAGGGVELPFGGVRKSGHGREKGLIALEEYSRLKTIVSQHD